VGNRIGIDSEDDDQPVCIWNTDKTNLWHSCRDQVEQVADELIVLWLRYADLCRRRHKSAYADLWVMPTGLLEGLPGGQAIAP
jgi:hypothetical protein